MRHIIESIFDETTESSATIREPAAVLSLLIAIVRELPDYRVWQKKRDSIAEANANGLQPDPLDVQIEHRLRSSMIRTIVTACGLALFGLLVVGFLIFALITVFTWQSIMPKVLYRIVKDQEPSTFSEPLPSSLRSDAICPNVARDFPSDPDCASRAFAFTNGTCKIPKEFMPLNPDYEPFHETTLSQFCSYLVLHEQRTKQLTQ